MSWINETGQFNAEADGMPESVKTLVSSKGLEDVEGLANIYINAEKKLGVPSERLLTIPKDPNDNDGWGNVYAKLGRPNTPDDYKLDVKVPDGVQLNDEIARMFKQKGHEIGLNNSQISKIVQFQLDTSAEFLKNSAEEEQKAAEVKEADRKNAQARAMEVIKVKHSIKTDDEMKSLLTGARETATKLGLLELFEKHGLGDDPEVIGRLIAIKQMISESIIPGAGVSDATTRQERLNQLMDNPAFTNNMHPNHGKVMKEYMSLFGVPTS